MTEIQIPDESACTSSPAATLFLASSIKTKGPGGQLGEYLKARARELRGEG